MDILEAIRLYFWAIAGGLVSLVLLYVAVAGFVQGARPDALALTLLALASALIGVSLFRGASGDRSWPKTVIGLSGLALFVLTVRYWKPKPDQPPRGADVGAQAWRLRHKRSKDRRNKRRHKSA